MGQKAFGYQRVRAFLRQNARKGGGRGPALALFDINVISVAPDWGPVSPRPKPQNTGAALESLASHGVCSYSLTVK